MLDAIPQLLGVVHVLGRQARDPLGVDGLEFQRHAEGQRGQDHQLVGGVDALDVKGGIGLGVTERLRLGEHLGELPPLVAHLGENEVSGAVDDARQPLDAVAGQALAQRLDDGDSPCDGRLEADRDAVLLRQGENFVAELGDQRLVGGDDVLARANPLLDQLPRHGGAADQLHQHLHVGIAGHLEDVAAHRGVPQCAGGVVAPGAHPHQFDRGLGARVDLLPVALQHVERAAAHRPQPADTYFYRFQADTQSVLIREPGASRRRPPTARVRRWH